MSASERGVSVFCSTCNLNFSSRAQFSIHEFSKKHCDNLVRLSKNKPIKEKHVKVAADKSETIPDSVNVCTEPGNFALYGYFNASETAEKGDGYQSREYNYDYDPYQQKLAGAVQHPNTAAATSPPKTVDITTLSRGKKKKIKTCQICSITLMNIPQYEAHMKSSEHVAKLKMSGMGVSAHFVKASCDLHTTELSNDMNTNSGNQSVEVTTKVAVAPSELFCDLCEVLLNSQCQYEAHLKGKSHVDRMNKKNEEAKKDMNKRHSTNHLVCHSCSLYLNNLAQFKEHVKGKKHAVKCRKLIHQGITIPPEERTPTMPLTISLPGKTVLYPESYKDACEQTEKITSTQTLSGDIKQVSSPTPLNNDDSIGTLNDGVEFSDENYKCSLCKEDFVHHSLFDDHLKSEEHALAVMKCRLEGESAYNILHAVLKDRARLFVDRDNKAYCGLCGVTTNGKTEMERHCHSTLHKHEYRDYVKKRQLEIGSISAIDTGHQGQFLCLRCKNSWTSLLQFNAHIPCHSVQHQGPEKVYGWRNIEERNPGVRTKVGGIAVDLISGAVQTVPNLETFEPIIDPAKNVALGMDVNNGSLVHQYAQTQPSNIPPLMRATTSIRPRPPWDRGNRFQPYNRAFRTMQSRFRW